MLNGMLNLKGDEIKMFSFHNTTPFTMNSKKRQYGGLNNAYAGLLQDHFQYVSDSNGYWRFRSWEELLSENHRAIQVLTHPVWWCIEDGEPAEKVCKEIIDRSERHWKTYTDTFEGQTERINETGLPSASNILPEFFSENGNSMLLLCLSGRYQEVYLEIFIRFEQLIRKILFKLLQKKFFLSSNQINLFLRDKTLNIDPLIFLNVIIEKNCENTIGCDENVYRSLLDCRDDIIKGYFEYSKNELKEKIDLLSLAYKSLSESDINSPKFLEGFSNNTININSSEFLFWLKKQNLNFKLQETLQETLLDDFIIRTKEYYDMEKS